QNSSQTTAFEAELTRVQAAETPSWADYATTAGALVPILAMAAAVALLSSSARVFFNPRPAAASEDGYQYGGYFCYPAQQRRTGTPLRSVSDRTERADRTESALPRAGRD